MSILAAIRPAVAALALFAATAAAVAGEKGAVAAAPTLPSDPCGFYRGQAYGRGLEHFATEMLWACEAVAARRAAAMMLSERMLAVELALERYRAAVIEAGGAAFARDRAREYDTGYFGAGEAAKAALAESTGMLAALEGVRSGF